MGLNFMFFEFQSSHRYYMIMSNKKVKKEMWSLYEQLELEMQVMVDDMVRYGWILECI